MIVACASKTVQADWSVGLLASVEKASAKKESIALMSARPIQSALMCVEN